MNSELSHFSCIFIILPKVSYFIEHTWKKWPFTPKLNKTKVKENTAWCIFIYIYTTFMRSYPHLVWIMIRHTSSSLCFFWSQPPDVGRRLRTFQILSLLPALTNIHSYTVCCLHTVHTPQTHRVVQSCARNNMQQREVTVRIRLDSTETTSQKQKPHC